MTNIIFGYVAVGAVVSVIAYLNLPANGHRPLLAAGFGLVWPASAIFAGYRAVKAMRSAKP